MELYGSLFNISGSITASAFTGSYIGDGAGLYNLPASGVTGLNLSQITSGNATASISSTAFTVNKNTQIQGNLSVTGSIIATEYIVSSSVTYMTTSFASGSTAFGNDNNDVHQFTGSVQITGSISLNGQAIGTGKLDETTFQSYTSSNNSRVSALETSTGSLNSFTSSINTTIKSKLDSEGVISGSVQVNITGTTGYSTFSSSISSSVVSLSSSIASTTNNLSTDITNLSSSVATTDLNQSNRLNSIEGVTGSYATTGSNTFKGTQNISGSIIPTVDNAYDLGSPTYQWRDVYISSGSLYIDGTKVLSSTTQELTITTDTGQSIKILEGTTDSIILQVADGDIELKSSGDGDILLDPTNGKIMLKGTVEILNGQKIQSSVGGTPIVFANDIVVSGSIDITGTIEGINLTDLSSSVNTRLGNLETSGGSLNSFTASANNRLNSLESASGSLNSYTSSNNTRLSTIETTTGSLNSYTASNNTRLSSIETTTSSILSVNTTQNGRLDSLETTSGSILSVNTTQNGRLSSIEGKSGSYATTGSNIFQGDQTITGSLYVSQNLIIAGSSQITFSGISGLPTLVSGSSQVSFTGLSNIPGGIVSGSAQVDLTATTNYSTGIKTRLNAEGVISGSAQITLTSTQVTNGLGFTPYNATNPSGYITGINSSAVTTALGYTPYNSTNPSGYITGISFANVSSKPTTISGYGITDAITTGNISSQTVSNSSQLQGLSKVQLWNNSGQNHSTYQTFAAIPNFGVWFMQASAAADTPQSASQYYVQTQGLGNDYAYGTYGLMTAVARDHAVKYTYYRTQENGTWGAWTKAAAGYADTAGSLSSMNISQFTNNSGYITGVTNISGTAASETLATVTGRGNSTAQNIVFSNGRKGLVGVYDAAQTQAIFAMGASYVLTDGGGSGTIGNHYGLAWSYNPDYGGAGNNPQSKAGLNHQLLHMQAGVTTTAIGSGIWTSGGITCGTVLPLSNNSYNLGSTGTRWANIYTNDLHLSNEGKEGGNEIDGTTGDWTIQEGEENLYIINHKNGKKFKIDLTEIV